MPNGSRELKIAGNRGVRLLVMLLVSIAVATGGMATQPPVTQAAQKKVVLVVGPVGSMTAYYKRESNELAAWAANLGAKVIKVYSPNATWARVKSVAQGANLLVYMGHGNGWPSPYKPFQTRTKDGMGLNSVAGQGNNNNKYWGEAYIAADINLARNAMVLLQHLCYASGNPEWGLAAPTKSVAMQRVDNYGAGFLRTGARVVLAETLGKARYVINGLWGSNKTMSEIFWSAPNRVGTYRIKFSSSRTSGARAEMDPNPRIKGTYWRSIVGDLSMTAGQWRSP